MTNRKLCLATLLESSELSPSIHLVHNTVSIRIMESAVEAPIAPANLFEYRHTAKKRRFIRKRDADTEENETASEGLQPSATSDAPGTNGEASSGEARNGDAMEVDGEEEKGLSLAEILRRRRKPNRPKGLDVVTPVPRISREPDSEAPPSEDEAVKETDQELQAVVNRFTHQTGQILDVDKHMYARTVISPILEKP